MFVKEFFLGLSAYGKAKRVIFKYKLWPYMIIPGVMSFLYVLLLVVYGLMNFGDYSTAIYQAWIPDFMKWKAVEVITNILLWILLFLAGYLTYKPVILILFSPVLSYLSEITENHVYERPSPDFTFKQFVKDLVRGIVINVRNLCLALALMLLATLLILVPVVGAFVSTVCIMLINFNFDGFSLFDYTLERKQYSVKESIQFARENRGRVMGVGCGFILMLMIPVLGWFTAPSFGTVAATLAALEKINTDDPVLAGL